MNNKNNEETIELWPDCIINNSNNKKIDIEKGFNYLNPFFITISFILISVFIFQIQWDLFSLWDKIDLKNFTFKYSNYWSWGNTLWIFTSMFLHWWFEHLIWNLIFFYIFSLIIYRIFNLLISFSLFIILWIISAIPWYFLNDLPSIWASWAIFWLFGISTIFYFINKWELENNLLDIFWVLIFLAWYEIFLWFNSTIIDNFAHISWYIWWLIVWYILLKNKNINYLS